jgi:hypothetical protein
MVSALDVIEHIPHGTHERALAESSRVAETYILLNVPYKENRLLATSTFCGCRFNPHYHMRSFCERNLFDLFPEFKVVRSWHVLRRVSVMEAIVNPMHSRIFGEFPAYCVCPQCGHTPKALTEKNLKQESVGEKMRRLVKAVARFCRACIFRLKLFFSIDGTMRVSSLIDRYSTVHRPS